MLQHFDMIKTKSYGARNNQFLSRSSPDKPDEANKPTTFSLTKLLQRLSQPSGGRLLNIWLEKQKMLITIFSAVQKRIPSFKVQLICLVRVFSIWINVKFCRVEKGKTSNLDNHIK